MITIEERTIVHAPIERCFDLARSVEVHLAGNVHWGEQAIAAGGVTTGLLEAGQTVTWRARHFGVRQTLTSKISAIERPVYFEDIMLKGAFRSMEHQHFFHALANDRTEMLDRFTFSAPLGPLGRIVEELVLDRYMRRLLRERNHVLREIAESEAWRAYLPHPTSTP